MLKVGEFLKYLIASKVDSSFLRAFIPYAQHSLNAEDTLCAEHLNSFVRQALHYTHWQQNRQALTAEMQDSLAALFEQDLISFSPTELEYPQDLQVVEIENTAEWIEALQNFLKKSSPSDAETRVIQDTEGTALGFALRATGELSVHHFNRQVTFRRGLIEPLRKDLALHYSNELELSSLHPQRWEIAPYAVASFSVQENGYEGAVLRGHTFQLQSSFTETGAEHLPHLFWALRRVEQHFLSRESDPFYQNLLAAMEAATLSIRIGEAGSTEKAVDALAQTQNALENVFVGDKLLALLIRDLQHTLELYQPDVRSRREVIQRVPSSRAQDLFEINLEESAPQTRRNRQIEPEL
jgi:hypothetical protein